MRRRRRGRPPRPAPCTPSSRGRRPSGGAAGGRGKAGGPARPPRSSTRSTTRWPRSARWSPTNPSRPSACSGPSGACGARERGRVPLGKVPYRSVDALLSRALAAEDPATAALMGELACVRRRGWFTRGEFLRMCRWKSPRAFRHYASNPAARVRRVSRAVLAARSERRRLALLTRLRGVSVPTASAILTLIDPRRYGVLDIRAWQLLFGLGAVERKPAGGGVPPRRPPPPLPRARGPPPPPPGAPRAPAPP